MKRTRLVTGSLVVLTLAAAACGSSGPKALSEDDFVSEMNAICRTADRSINKLDSTDKSYISDISDIVQNGLDEFAKLKPPKSLQADFDDYTSNLDDQLTQFGKLTKAIRNGDTEAENKASDKLTKLSTEGDDLATSIGADKCVELGGGAAPATTDTESTDPITTDSVPDTTTAAADTTEATTADTATPNTPLPIDTTPDTEPMMTAPPSTAGSSGGVTAGDASTGFSPIAGYTWGTLTDITATVTPSQDPVVGPVLSGYYVGVMNSTADGSQVYVYVTILNDNAPWTPAQLSAYYTFELVGDGQDITLPTLGRPARTKANVVEGYDVAVFTIDGVGVSVLAPTGSAVAQLEAFVVAQSAG